ncbi:MAG: hypothetical protein CSA75_04245 [Sorangium cellulosum]|nr:MAG: hypothetical protein CSA75_04245 [Sorangium cellulosum]
MTQPAAPEPSKPAPNKPKTKWLAPNGLCRRLLLGAVLYFLCTAVFFGTASSTRIFEHTPYNHYALLADAWLHGQLDLRGPPPPYAGGNDFARMGDKWYISFPPFPAVWLLPWVKLGGSVENVRDGQAFFWLAGVGPAVLWLVLEKLRRRKHSSRKESTNFILSLLFAFGTVYWFTSIQGTVWFAAHVVAVAIAALFLLCALDAERPFLTGLLLGLAFLTRPPMLLMSILFATEAFRMSVRGGFPSPRGGKLSLIYETLRALDAKKLTKTLSLFLIPLVALLCLALWHNNARFGDPFEFGHEHLTVGWQGRIQKWGLFSYHYFGRNLSVVLASVPYLNRVPSGLQINAHGLALWITSPFFLWALWPKKKGWLYGTIALTILAVALPGLLYQNTGWMQFGYRFSNDFALMVFLLLSIGGRRFGGLFYLAAIFAVVVNGFGAMTFERKPYKKFYHIDSSQKTLFQPD